uniref:Uncharacterized protein n=1 Tax=Oryza brachyantha TaxID=4533 RepID=J3L175_ORYBR
MGRLHFPLLDISGPNTVGFLGDVFHRAKKTVGRRWDVGHVAFGQPPEGQESELVAADESTASLPFRIWKSNMFMRYLPEFRDGNEPNPVGSFTILVNF